MALTPGSRLGPYEVTSQIGVGGMGEVYRARDTKLDRTFAGRPISHEKGEGRRWHQSRPRSRPQDTG